VLANGEDTMSGRVEAVGSNDYVDSVYKLDDDVRLGRPDNGLNEEAEKVSEMARNAIFYK
jgi:hypothetical protein